MSLPEYFTNWHMFIYSGLVLAGFLLGLIIGHNVSEVEHHE